MQIPDLEELARIISAHHALGRPIAAHCVSREALLILLAVLGEVRPISGDRIEHGALIPAESIEEIGRLGLTLVTQPGFIADRGDDYLEHVDPMDIGDLYRCRTLLNSSVPIALSSDAPYGPLSPWTVIAAAQDRRTPIIERLRHERPETNCGIRHGRILFGSGPTVVSGFEVRRPGFVRVGDFLDHPDLWLRRQPKCLHLGVHRMVQRECPTIGGCLGDIGDEVCCTVAGEQRLLRCGSVLVGDDEFDHHDPLHCRHHRPKRMFAPDPTTRYDRSLHWGTTRIRIQHSHSCVYVQRTARHPEPVRPAPRGLLLDFVDDAAILILPDGHIDWRSDGSTESALLSAAIANAVAEKIPT